MTLDSPKSDSLAWKFSPRRMLVGCKIKTCQLQRVFFSQDMRSLSYSTNEIGRSSSRGREGKLSTIIFQKNLDVAVNNAAFWIGVKKPQSSSTVDCNLKPLGPRKDLVFPCREKICMFLSSLEKMWTKSTNKCAKIQESTKKPLREVSVATELID